LNYSITFLFQPVQTSISSMSPFLCGHQLNTFRSDLELL